MFLIFFLIFVATPILEIVLFIEIGGFIGVGPTILIVIVTALVGSILLRLQGSAVIRRTQMALRAGELPVDPVIDGISLLVAGALLLTPGFFTDAVGFLLFVPPFRRALARRIFLHMVRSGNVFVAGAGPEGEPPHGRRERDEERRGRGQETIIDVEYEPVDDERERRDEDERDDDEPPRRRRGASPWRK
ncbi:FxsA family protein [Dichotomicrobium thermohalophilum]|nr:FxsA family protein [Dichotomicrobium thermohalophilum]